MSTYRLDSFHPDVLRCRDCGAFVANVSELARADDLPADPLTARQAVRCWPGAAQAIVTHDVTCSWRLLAEAEGLTGEQQVRRTG